MASNNASLFGQHEEKGRCTTIRLQSTHALAKTQVHKTRLENHKTFLNFNFFAVVNNKMLIIF